MGCQNGLTAAFCAAGNLQIPQEALYKKNVLITRGRFRPFTLLHNDMLIGAASQFFCDPDNTGVLSSQDMVGESGDAYTECVYRDDTLVLLELTTRDMMEVRVASVCARIHAGHLTYMGIPDYGRLGCSWHHIARCCGCS